MRHPFDGINEPTTSSRRGILGLLAAAAGYFGFGAMAQAAAPPASKIVVVEANPEPPMPTTKAKIPAEAGGKPVTNAIGEDGRPRFTTLAVGEGGGAVTKALREAGASTRALGEEGGIKMTKALKEDGKAPGIATTLAVGEEGAKKADDR